MFCDAVANVGSEPTCPYNRGFFESGSLFHLILWINLRGKFRSVPTFHKAVSPCVLCFMKFGAYLLQH